MSDEPELRDGPPWAMEEMILAEPELASARIERAGEAGELVRAAVAAGEPVRLVGCGTSEHAATAGAELRRAALGSELVVARDAFEASRDPQSGGVLVGVSHEAGTPATLAAVRAAASRGARSVLITARPDQAPAGPLVVATPLRDTAWCHTVGYLSPLLAFLAMSGGEPAAARGAIEAMLARRDELAAAAEAV